MFQILEFTEARLSSITNRAEKHGDDEKPAISLGFEIETANTLLDAIDPKLRHALYTAVEGQDMLPGIEPSTPVLRANAIDRVQLVTKHEGWTLEMDDGIDDTAPMVFGGCKVDKFSVEPRQGGSIVLRLRVGTSDISADKLGKIGMHLAQSVWIIVRPPEAPADVIDGSVDAFHADHPEADLFSEPDPVARDAGTIFSEQHGGQQNVEAGPGAGDYDQAGGQNWPMPNTGASSLDATVEMRQSASAEPVWPEPQHAQPKPYDEGDEDLEEGIAAAIAKRPKAAAKYRCPQTGNTWSGRGLQPKWLKVALSRGKKLADFEVGAAVGLAVGLSLATGG